MLPRLIRQSRAEVLISAGNFALRKSPVPQILLSRNALYTSADFFRDLRARRDYRLWLDRVSGGDDPLFHAIVEPQSARAFGVASYMRIDPAAGVIEVGGINYAPPLQRTPAATEAMYLMMRRVFDELGYRRYEWKCDSLNAPSRVAALRLGFRYEGMFRQATVYKARNRDTCWFSILDSEWPVLKTRFECWLDPGNFDAAGRQRHSLSSFAQDARL